MMGNIKSQVAIALGNDANADPSEGNLAAQDLQMERLTTCSNHSYAAQLASLTGSRELYLGRIHAKVHHTVNR